MTTNNVKPIKLSPNQQVFIEGLEATLAIAKTGQLVAGCLITVEADGHSETKFAFENPIHAAQLAFGGEILKASILDKLFQNLAGS